MQLESNLSILNYQRLQANILVKKNSVWERHRAVLADFGAAEFDDESIATERRATNKRWLAPELLNVLASRNSSKVEEVHSIDGAGASDTVSVYEDCNSVFLSDSDNNNDGDAEESDGTESCATELVVSNEVVRMVSKPGDIYAFGCTVLEVGMIAVLLGSNLVNVLFRYYVRRSHLAPCQTKISSCGCRSRSSIHFRSTGHNSTHPG